MYLNDKDIRHALKRQLELQYSTDGKTIILDELGVRHGAARVDIAVINDQLLGYEIKSDMDTLDRLPNQVRLYNSVFDKISITVGQRYFGKIIENVPDWWGIVLAEMINDEIILSIERLPQLNPEQDIIAITKLLWRREALALLDELHCSDGFRYKPRKVVYTHLVNVANPMWLHARVCLQLRARTNWRADSQQM